MEPEDILAQQEAEYRYQHRLKTAMPILITLMVLVVIAGIIAIWRVAVGSYL